MEQSDIGLNDIFLISRMRKNTFMRVIKDYTTDNALVIPVNVLQTDESGKYVYIMELLNGKMWLKNTR